MFLKTHRIRSEAEREALFAHGNSFVEFPFKFVYVFTPAEKYSAKLLVSVPKKRVRHAVDRNFVKRRIREAFRLFEKQMLAQTQAPCGELSVAIIFMSEKHELAKKQNSKLLNGLTTLFAAV